MIQIQSKDEIVPLIKDVCTKLTGHAHDNEVQLMLGTWAAENGAMHRRQIGGGPARGLWQVETATAQDIFNNYLPSRALTYNKLIRIWFDIEAVVWYYWFPTDNDVSKHLQMCDDFCCAMARIKYLRDPDLIPDTLEGQAAYWVRVYNGGGKGTVEHYLSQWKACECKQMLCG